MCCMLSIFQCHHELRPTPVSHPFSSLNSSLGLAGGKHYQKITIPVFRLLFVKILLIQVAFLILCVILLYLLTFFWLSCYCCMWLYFSLSPIKSQLNRCLTFLCFFFIFLKLIVPCRLCVIYFREANDGLWLHDLYGLHGPQCWLSEKGH